MMKLGFPTNSVFRDAFSYKYQNAKLIEVKIIIIIGI